MTTVQTARCMEPFESPTGSSPLTVTSYDTALCIIPPKDWWQPVDDLRRLCDKAYGKWPPHANLIYPFVAPENLHKAVHRLKSALRSRELRADQGGLRVSLNATDVFAHRRDNTIFVYDDSLDRANSLKGLRHLILRALGQKANDYHMHMTIGQSRHLDSDFHKILLHEASLLPAIEWDLEHLQILVRKRALGHGDSKSSMKLWGSLNLRSLTFSLASTAFEFYTTPTNSPSHQAGGDA